MTYSNIVMAAAKAAKVSAALLYAICAHESRDFSLDFSEYDAGSPSYSVCQVKAETAKMLGFNQNSDKLRNALVGIKYAALYLKYQQDRYGDNWVKLVSSYNAGSFLESSRVKGCPKNLHYVKLVRQKLPEYLRYKLDCGR